jgi:hypothetical protein
MEASIRDAYCANTFPCNPLPFLNAITTHVRENGTASIRDDDVKRAMLILVQQCYGQATIIDTVGEYSRIKRIDERMQDFVDATIATTKES